MPNWLKIIAGHHAKAHANDGYTLVTRPAASAEQLDRLAVSLGIALPSEFRELYSACNGFGVASDNELDKTWWLFRPTDQIESFAGDVRSWFAETHQSFANRFFPFIDFSNGDGIGYIVDESGAIIDGLFCFEHENYEFDAEQDVNEFITHSPVTIEEFLTRI